VTLTGLRSVLSV